ncbi:hypothetical protein [Vibrio quintilis]|uniref:Uncharacterized protein n=1 Tax=Vibrio quintilis TaxID=1117707 RepID=A0A1M7Z1J7_9VIBR|nr:hypothetical protein [Vibrio quintilis]SHO58743.1 hypothetical protein VQ7734_04515 [Vibrio quintilis]
MQSIVTEIKGTTDQLILTDDHLYLFFGKDPSERYLIDLFSGKHEFFVKYFDAECPLIAAYLPEGNREAAIEIETSVIDELHRQNFISKIEIYDENVELARPRNHPQDCLITIDMSETISSIEQY